jgi:hypothetical protein
VKIEYSTKLLIQNVEKPVREKRKSNANDGDGAGDDATGGPAKKPRKQIKARSFVCGKKYLLPHNFWTYFESK